MTPYLDAALEIAEPWATAYVAPAFSGDPEAAFGLAAALGNENRGIVAVLMWRARVTPEAFRAFLGAAWLHDHHHVIDAAGSRRTLAAMFRDAAFPLPDWLPAMVTVWRGIRAPNQRAAAAGYSWTLDRDIACWFALWTQYGRQTPVNWECVVLKAEVPRSAIYLYHDERQEQEVLLLAPPAKVFIDGDLDDWRAGAARRSASDVAA